MAGQQIALSPTRRAGGEREQLAAVLRELAVARRECRWKHRQIEAHERGLVRLSRTVSDRRRATMGSATRTHVSVAGSGDRPRPQIG